MNTVIQAVLDHKGCEVATVEPDTTVRVAVTLMNDLHIGSLLVTEGDQVVGIVTERDVLVRVVVEMRDPASTAVRDVMTTKLVVIQPDTTVEQALRLISAHRCRHLPVIQDGRLIGLISAGDLNVWIVRAQKLTIHDLYDYVTR